MQASLPLFCIAVTAGKWKPYDHSVFVSEAVQNAMETPGSRVILEIPPRHGKTYTSIVYGGAWYLKNWPGKTFAYVAHTQSLADKYSEKCRLVFESLPYGQGLAADSRAKQNWSTAGLGGGFFSTGVGGPVTGIGFDFMAVDDPVKNQEEAYSAVYRDKTYAYYTDTLRDRMQPGGSILLIMQRWHEDDLAGRLIKDGGWDVIRLPALAEEEDPLGRDPGAALCPQMFDVAALNALKKDMGSKTFEAKYQQNPIHLSGAMFKPEWFRYFDLETDRLTFPDGKKILLSECRIFQTVDPAGTEGKLSDYFVCGTFAQDRNNNLYLMDIARTKAETTRHAEILRQTRDRWQPYAQYVENKVFGINAIQNAKKDGMPVRKLEADRSKVLRAEEAVTFYENAMIYHRRNAPWLAALEDELSQFPNGEHDDQVDVISYAAIIARQRATTNWREKYLR